MNARPSSPSCRGTARRPARSRASPGFCLCSPRWCLQSSSLRSCSPSSDHRGFARYLPEKESIIVLGLIFPAVTLPFLFAYSVWLILPTRAADGALRIEVIGEQWWWRVDYDGRAPTSRPRMRSRIPVDQPVELVLKSADVIHSFWVPNLAGKLDMIPGRMNRLRLTAERAGVFRGQCADIAAVRMRRWLCMSSHAATEFNAWLARRWLRALRRLPNRSTRRKLFLGRCCGIVTRCAVRRQTARSVRI